ncbi:MAG: 4Fe-4S binding protein [Actinobacteria bacterium]|nr:4Fe-4S binding protein [Actinomycetota bacterium]
MKNIKNWKYNQHLEGALIPEAGNAEYYKTGGWRTERPVIDKEKCTNCLFCWIFCPDTSVIVEDAKIKEFDYDHCKGCGVCAVECPKSAISMIDENEFKKQENT